MAFHLFITSFHIIINVLTKFFIFFLRIHLQWHTFLHFSSCCWHYHPQWTLAVFFFLFILRMFISPLCLEKNYHIFYGIPILAYALKSCAIYAVIYELILDDKNKYNMRPSIKTFRVLELNMGGVVCVAVCLILSKFVPMRIYVFYFVANICWRNFNVILT